MSCYISILGLNEESNVMESKHNGIKAFKCNSCDYASEYKGNLNKHIMSVHDRNKPFKCKLCKYAGICNSDLKKHEISVHKKNETSS